MVTESSVKNTDVFMVDEAVSGKELLPAVAGKSYRIKTVQVHAHVDAAHNGSMLQVAATNQTGETKALARLVCLFSVDNVQNVVVPGQDFITKAGTAVWLSSYGGITFANGYLHSGAIVTYTEIDW